MTDRPPDRNRYPRGIDQGDLTSEEAFKMANKSIISHHKINENAFCPGLRFVFKCSITVSVGAFKFHKYKETKQRRP